MKKEAAASVLLLVAVALVLLNLPSGQQTETSYNASFIVDGEKAGALTLEVANTTEEREQGLMHRESLPDNHGMLFVFPDEKVRPFWMKNTLIPLDMIFISSNLTVLNVEEAYTQPNATDEELTIYTSDGPAKYVIETHRGFAAEHGIEAGTEVVFNEKLSQEYR